VSSLCFHFHYTDGTVPFDPEADERVFVFVKDLSEFEAPEVSVEGWCDLIDVSPEDFDMTPEDYAEAGLPENAFFPSFLKPTKDAIESAKDDSFIPLTPSELQDWATLWRNTLLAIPEDEVEGLFQYNSYGDARYREMLIEELGETIEQARCAQQHKVGMVLHITW